MDPIQAERKDSHAEASRWGLVIALALGAIPALGPSSSAHAADVSVNVASQKQVIDGFGASSAWCGTISDNVMNVLYGDLGFSILRVRIEEGIGDNNWKSGPYTSWAPELANAKKAIAKGAVVFATPWNPPPALRLNTAASMRKYSIDENKFATYRDYLNTYTKYFKDNGVNLEAISVQNEPDYAGEWTYWSATQIKNFILNYGASITTKLISAESFNFSKGLYDAILNDPATLANVDIVGLHLYGTSVNNFAYPLFEQKGRPAGKKLWQTEHYVGGDEQTTANVMDIGKEIHDCMVTGNMNAYTYWWITWDNGLAKSAGTIFKRAYAIGQFSKHVRPGYFRVDATATPATNVYVSAYSGGGKVVIVAVNTGTGSVNQKFNISGATVAQMSTWETSASKNMAAGTAVTVAGGAFSTTLPGQSITTFVGTNTSSSIALRSNSVDMGFKARLSNGNIVVTPSCGESSYNVSVRLMNGQQTVRKNDLKGVSSISVTGKGVYLVDIELDGQRQREIVHSF